MEHSVRDMSPKLVIWGAGGHASVVADIVCLRGDYVIVGFLDDMNPDRWGTDFCGAQVLGGREQLPILRRQGVGYAVLAFGNCRPKLLLGDLLHRSGFSLATAVHPQAAVAAGATIAAGTVIVAGAVVQPGVQIGQSVLVNSCASIGHHSSVGDGSHICPGVCIGGYAHVGQATWVGIGATVKDRVTIGDHCLIGAGALVLDDVPDGVVAYGVPARVQRRVREDEP